jgi:hypothetical protein
MMADEVEFPLVSHGVTTGLFFEFHLGFGQPTFGRI